MCEDNIYDLSIETVEDEVWLVVGAAAGEGTWRYRLTLTPAEARNCAQRLEEEAEKAEGWPENVDKTGDLSLMRAMTAVMRAHGGNNDD